MHLPKNLGVTVQRVCADSPLKAFILGFWSEYPASVVRDTTLRDLFLLPLLSHGDLKGLCKRAKHIQKTARSIVVAKKSHSFEGKTFVDAVSC